MSAALKLEENSVNPWKHEVVSRASKERTDDDQHCPEHQEDRHHAGHELAILGMIGHRLIKVRSKHQRNQTHRWQCHTRNHWVEHGE